MQPRLGFMLSPALATTAVGLGPVGWVLIGASTALTALFFRAPRGEYQKFDREVYPTIASLSKYTSLDTITGWHEELVGVDADGNRKVYGSWIGEGPTWGDKAAAKIMELGQENFLWSFQPGRSDGPWVLVGPHPTLGSVVYDVFYALQAAIDYWDRERERMMREWEAGQEPAPPTAPGEYEPEPIKPEDVVPPPSPPPIDPPAPPPSYPMPPPRQPGIVGPGGILSKLPQILGGIFGGGRRTPTNGRYPPGTRPPGAGPFGDIAQDDWLYIAAAGVLLLAAFQKKKKKK